MLLTVLLKQKVTIIYQAIRKIIQIIYNEGCDWSSKCNLLSLWGAGM